MAPRYDFNLLIGDSYPPGDDASFTVTYSTGPSLFDLTPYDLSTATIEGELCEVQGGENLVNFEIVKFDQDIDPGKFSWRIPASETSALERKRYFWRLYIAWPGSDSKTTLLEGRLGCGHAH